MTLCFAKGPQPAGHLHSMLTDMAAASAWRQPEAMWLAEFDGFSAAGSAGVSHGSVGDTTVLLDGRLDNTGELSHSLGIDRRTGPASVIAHAFQRWGEAALPRIIGDFAYVIHAAGRDTTLLVRDHIGVRPLFFAQSDGTVVAASTLDSVLSSGLRQPRLDDDRLIRLLVNDFGPDGRTSYRGIERVLAGSYVRVVGTDPAAVRRARYWNLPDVEEDRDYADTVGELRALLGQAVADRIDGPRRVVSQLSGGLDSSSITRLAQGINPDTETVSLRFRAPFASIDEGPFIEAVREGMSGAHHEVDGAAEVTLQTHFEGASTWPEPWMAPNHQFTLSTLQQLSQLGPTLCIGGFDGDSVVSHGRGLLGDLAMQGASASLRSASAAFSEVTAQSVSFVNRAYVAPSVAAGIVGLRLLPAARAMRAMAAGSDPTAAARSVGGAMKDMLRARRTSFVMDAQSPLTPDALAPIVGDLKQLAIAAVTPTSEHQSHVDVLTAPLLGFGLEALDHHARISGVDLAHPFLDVRVVELMVSAPAAHKLRDGWTRRPLRDAMQGLIPEKVRWRADKANFEPVFLANLADRESELVRHLINDEVWRLGGVVDRHKLDALAARTLNRGRVDVRDAYTLWRITAALAWLTKRNLSV